MVSDIELIVNELTYDDIVIYKNRIQYILTHKDNIMLVSRRTVEEEWIIVDDIEIEIMSTEPGKIYKFKGKDNA